MYHYKGMLSEKPEDAQHGDTWFDLNTNKVKVFLNNNVETLYPAILDNVWEENERLKHENEELRKQLKKVTNI